MPRIKEIFDRFGGDAPLFSRPDLTTVFHQSKVATEDIEKITLKTKYSHFDILVMHMWLRNAPATFPDLMNAIV